MSMVGVGRVQRGEEGVCGFEQIPSFSLTRCQLNLHYGQFFLYGNV